MDMDRRQSTGYEYLCHLQVIIQWTFESWQDSFLLGGEAVDGGVHQGGVAGHHRAGGGVEERGHPGKAGTLHGTNSCSTQVPYLCAC